MNFNWGLLIPLLAIAGWASIIMYRMYLVGRVREQKHRERLAMIERGLTPPPEVDTEKIDALTDWNYRGPSNPAHNRRNGILMMCIGIGLTLMFYIQGQQRTIGVGALVFLIGVAFYINEVIEARARRDESPTPPKA